MEKLDINLKAMLEKGNPNDKVSVVVTGKNGAQYGLTPILGLEGIYHAQLSVDAIKKLEQQGDIDSIALDNEYKAL